jgi:HipA-like protein
MKNYINRIFNKPENEDKLVKYASKSARFELKISNLLIGALYSEDNKWYFEYSDEFKVQNKYYRIVGFSDLNKKYESETLWPFFKIRIPGLKQPMIQVIIDKEEIDSVDESSLLKRFGKRIAANPYILENVL